MNQGQYNRNDECRVLIVKMCFMKKAAGCNLMANKRNYKKNCTSNRIYTTQEILQFTLYSVLSVTYSEGIPKQTSKQQWKEKDAEEDLRNDGRIWY
jgi:hypothetical protein